MASWVRWHATINFALYLNPAHGCTVPAAPCSCPRTWRMLVRWRATILIIMILSETPFCGWRSCLQTCVDVGALARNLAAAALTASTPPALCCFKQPVYVRGLYSQLLNVEEAPSAVINHSQV